MIKNPFALTGGDLYFGILSAACAGYPEECRRITVNGQTLLDFLKEHGY